MSIYFTFFDMFFFSASESLLENLLETKSFPRQPRQRKTTKTPGAEGQKMGGIKGVDFFLGFSVVTSMEL